MRSMISGTDSCILMQKSVGFKDAPSATQTDSQHFTQATQALARGGDHWRPAVGQERSIEGSSTP